MVFDRLECVRRDNKRLELILREGGGRHNDRGSALQVCESEL